METNTNTTTSQGETLLTPQRERQTVFVDVTTHAAFQCIMGQPVAIHAASAYRDRFKLIRSTNEN